MIHDLALRPSKTGSGAGARHARPAGDARAEPAGLRLALAGGGTGGHIVPGLNLLAHARERAETLPLPLADVVWFTSGRTVEERVLARLEADAGGPVSAPAIERVVLELEPAGGGAPSRGSLLLRTAPAVLRARRALAAHRSDVLLGLGGFTALPAVLAARSLGIPAALLEVNACDGAATRWLGRFASRVFRAWPGEPGEPARLDVVGPPLAPAFEAGPAGEAERRGARAALGFREAEPLLVVLGGSQGAQALNRFLRAHAPALVAGGLQVFHQTGPGRIDEGCPPFTGYRAVEYADPVREALAAATLVLCRGGASTLFEVAACGRPALVVPYPHHADLHQERNAARLGTGVRVVPESELGVGLRQEIGRLAGPRGEAEREVMSAALAAAAPRGGAGRLYAGLAEIARARHGA